MALIRTTRYPGYFTPADALQPQGGFKNRTAPDAKDGSYLEKDWANDWSGFFSALLVNAGISPNNLVDNATASQYYDAMAKLIQQISVVNSGDMTSGIVYFATVTPPSGYLKANGAAVRRADFPRLFARIGTSFGAGDGFSTFNLPDARGIFIRSLDDGAGVNPGRALGSREGSQNLTHNHAASSDVQGYHNHSLNIAASGQHSHTGTAQQAGDHSHGILKAASGNNTSGSWVSPANIGNTRAYTENAGNHTHSVAIDANGSHSHTGDTSANGQHSHTIYINASGGNESRPVNIAFLPCIKY